MTAPVCKCEEGGQPLCGFCQDDLYCPQCGSEITSVYCEDAQGESEVVWIYPQRSSEQFVFSLSLQCRDRDRSPRDSLPELDLEETDLDVNGWFDNRVERVGARADQRAMLYRLKPRTGVSQTPLPLAHQLPIEGVEAQLRAVGGFRDRQFNLRVCRAPTFQVQFSGDGILDSAGDERKTWRIWKRGPLGLIIQLEALSAPIYLEETLALVADGFVARLEDPVRKGEVLRPGDPPRQMALHIDSTTWKVDEKRELKLRIAVGGWGLIFESHFLQMVAMGDLRFSSGDRLLFEGKHLGDYWSQTVAVENVGDEAMWVQPLPELEPATQTWLRVQCLGNDAPGEPCPLAPGERFEMQIEVDLRQLREVDLPKDGELRATVVLCDEVRTWPLTVRVPQVTLRPSDNRWVAVDFGSTNTYVAVMQPSPRGAAQVVPVLLRGDPEKFCTAIYFEDVSDPQRPKYIVGPEAAQRGEAFPTALASGFKRWIGAASSNALAKRWYIKDAGGKECSYDAADLMRLFLRQVIHQCDEQLRVRVSKVGLSFPANFDRGRIRAIEEILRNLVRDLSEEDPPRELFIDPPRLDEATAVALGFGLNPDFIPEDKAADSGRSIVVGSFDFGGGTLDTAVIRLRFLGARLFARIESEYLGIGGDENFGGENVTLAIVEILTQRIEKLVRQHEVTERSPWQFKGLLLARSGEGRSTTARLNFDSLWAAAEQLKIHLCAAPPGLHGESTGEFVARQAVERLNLCVNKLRGLFTGPQGSPQERLLVEDDKLRAVLDQAVDTGELLAPLEEIYRHHIAHDLIGASASTIQQRLERCIDEMSKHAARHDARLDYLILAGAASRLPLVEELLRQKLPDTQIHFDRQRPKSKVAEGLIRFLHLRQMPKKVEKIRSPLDYNPAAIGLVAPATGQFVEIIPACSLLVSSQADPWFPLRDVCVQEVWSDDLCRCIQLYEERREGPHKLGHFDLSQPAHIAAAAQANALDVEGKLPPELRGTYYMALRFAEGLDRIELRVEEQGTGKLYGHWPLVAATSTSQPD